MKILIVILMLILPGFPVIYAQNVSVPQSVADGQVAQAKAQMDAEYQGIAGNNANTAQLQAQITTQQQAMLAVATQSPPLQSAVAVCESNPDLYCPGFTVTPLVSTGGACTQNSDCASNNCYGTSGVNWNEGTCQ